MQKHRHGAAGEKKKIETSRKELKDKATTAAQQRKRETTKQQRGWGGEVPRAPTHSEAEGARRV